ncbi:MAG: zinc-ribbon domain-containing protein [Burkholderiales bacterium]|nr:zinc-ribbon domain-containing protein [Burkholderiales bacterium]
MALATQCPHCQTVFRVAADQLKLRSGLVRCGSCKQIFNGIEHLVPQEGSQPPAAKPASISPAAPASAPATEPASPPSPVPAPVPIANIAPAPPAPVAASPAASTSGLDFVPLDGSDALSTTESAPPAPPPVMDASEPAHFPRAEPEPEDPLQPVTIMNMLEEEEQENESAAEPATPVERDEIVLETPAQEPPAIEATAADSEKAPAEPEPSIAEHASYVPPPPLPIETEDEHVPEGFDDDDEAVDTATTAVAEEEIKSSVINKQVVPAAPQEESDEPEEEIEETEGYEPSFVTRDKRRQRFRRISRVFMSLCSLILLLGLAAQGAYIFRNQLAALYPQTKPLLAELCLVAGCQVKLPAQIDMVSIESSELQAAAPNKNVFTLTVLLRNRSAVAQAWPDIELTLNDGNEKPVARRVLKPRDYLLTTQESVKGLTANSEQAVKLTFELDQLKASGYRVYLFYS